MHRSRSSLDRFRAAARRVAAPTMIAAGAAMAAVPAATVGRAAVQGIVEAQSEREGRVLTGEPVLGEIVDRGEIGAVGARYPTSVAVLHERGALALRIAGAPGRPEGVTAGAASAIRPATVVIGGVRREAVALNVRVLERGGEGRAWAFEVDGVRFETHEPGDLARMTAEPERAARELNRGVAFGATLLPATATREERQAWLDRWSTGATVDSLRTVLGEPGDGRLVAIDPRENPAVQMLGGVYQFDDDRLHLNLSGAGVRDEASLVRLAAHEFAHSLQARHGPELARLWADIPLPPDAVSYAGSSLIEHQAEALAEGWMFLRESAGAEGWRAGRGASARLAEVEAATPGVRRMTALLLSHPLFAEHPLRTGALRVSPALVPTAPEWTWGEVEGPEGERIAGSAGRWVTGPDGERRIVVDAGLSADGSTTETRLASLAALERADSSWQVRRQARVDSMGLAPGAARPAPGLRERLAGVLGRVERRRPEAERESTRGGAAPAPVPAAGRGGR